jgi:hypothetical protein
MLVHLPTNQLTERIIGCAMEVHRVLGPGLFEDPCSMLLVKSAQHGGNGETEETD